VSAFLLQCIQHEYTDADEWMDVLFCKKKTTMSIYVNAPHNRELSCQGG
jgi:hypothetical protein